MADKAKKERKAEHEYLGKDGSVVETEEEAFGIRYTDKASGGSVDWLLSEHGKGGQRMLAIFGMKTLATNTASQARQQRASGNYNGTDIDAIAARKVDLTDDRWQTPAERAGGPRYDTDALSQAIAQAKGETDPAPYLAKLEADAVEGSDATGPAYGRKAMRNPQVAAAYAKLRGKAEVTTADL